MLVPLGLREVLCGSAGVQRTMCSEHGSIDTPWLTRSPLRMTMDESNKETSQRPRRISCEHDRNLKLDPEKEI